MAAPAQINTLRATDFPAGLASKKDADKLFQILNPFLQQVGQTTNAGTSMGSNIDGQFAQMSVSKGSAWLPMTLTSPFTTNPFGWPNASYRIDGTGRLWCRGLFTAASAPTGNQVFWTYPSKLFGPPQGTVGGTGRLLTVPWVSNSFGTAAIGRMDADLDALMWGGVLFGQAGATAWANLSLGANIIGTFSYRLTGNGVVEIQGNIGTSTGGFTQMNVGTLPAGFRPASLQTMSVNLQSSAVVYSPGIMTITTAGVVTVFWSTGAMQVNGCGISGLFFDTGQNLALPSGINYGTLDGISWDTQGGPSLSTRPSFPLNIRLKDGKKPVVVICWAVNDDTQATETCAIPAWTYNGSGNTGNTLTINAVNDLRDDQGYTLNFFIFY